MSEGLRHGPLPESTAHLCVDMQNLFAPGAPWAAPWFPRVLPRVLRLCERHPAATVFSRFLPPPRLDAARDAWLRFYQRWPQLTGERIDPRLLQLTPELSGLAPPACIVDKRVYSPFHGTGLAALLAQRGVDTLVCSGTETDVCVLAAVMDAVDLGYRVIVARDAVCSSSDGTHDALMKLYHERFGAQIETADTAEILGNWPRAAPLS